MNNMQPEYNNSMLDSDRSIEEEEIDLREYWRVLKRHKWSVFSLSFLAAVLAALVVFSMKHVYQSNLTLLIEPQSNNVVSIEEVYGIYEGSEYYETQYEILQSRALIERVIEALKLTQNPEFLPDEEGGSLSLDFGWKAWLKQWLPTSDESGQASGLEGIDLFYEDVIKDVDSRLEISPVRDSQLVIVSFEANDRYLAAQMANALARLYIETDLESRMKMTTQASGWLTERLEALRVKLQDSEKALQAYREKERLIEVGGVSTLTAQQLQDLGQKLVLTREQRATAEASLRQIQAMKDQSQDQLSTIPAVLEDPLVATLKQQEAAAKRTVSTLTKRYGPKHPQMIQARADHAEAQAGVAKRIRAVIAGVEKNYQVARARQQSIQNSIASAKGEMQQINRKGYQLEVLEREVTSNRELYDLFLTRFKETKQASGLEKVNARVTDPAVPSVLPIKPKKKLIVVVAAALGLFMGILVAFLLEHLDNTLKRGGDLEERLKLPGLGVLPHLKLNKKKGGTPLRYARENPQSFFTESIRTIRTGILLSGLDDAYKVIVVTSSVPGEGKSTVATNLAYSLGELHKVLMIDADMRRPTVATNWGLDRKAPGLSEFVAGIAKISKCVHRIDESQVFVMPSGVVPPNPLELLSSHRFQEALESLGKAFDHIIIDSAPSLAVSDALVISAYASGVIYVVKADSTPHPAAQEGIKRLTRHGAHLIGGVLNDMPQGQESGYRGYGKYSYNDGYYGSYGYTKN
ncbi:MAG: polysaccharide biosynthesis tyrosine autokinase [Gammaproteobacteria bacterium]|nr:polysaccharide biosynthesis tyrosine autokinase [Gammaproteobacteria bacterium]